MSDRQPNPKTKRPSALQRPVKLAEPNVRVNGQQSSHVQASTKQKPWRMYPLTITRRDGGWLLIGENRIQILTSRDDHHIQLVVTSSETVEFSLSAGDPGDAGDAAQSDAPAPPPVMTGQGEYTDTVDLDADLSDWLIVTGIIVLFFLVIVGLAAFAS